MEKRKRKNRISFVIMILLIILLAAIPFLLEKNQKMVNSFSKDEIISCQPEIVTVEETISGTGTLASEEPENVSVPAGVEITGYLVSNYDTVSQGTPLAAVDHASVMVALSDCQKKLKSIEQEMDELRNWVSVSEDSFVDADGQTHSFLRYTANNDTDIHEYICSPVYGTVTAVYVKNGDNVLDAMSRYGCIAVVTFENGLEYKVTAAKGNINYIYHEVGDYVTEGEALFYLENVTNDAAVEVLAEQHRDYEVTLSDLIKLYEDGVVSAPCDGIITGIDEDAAEKLKTKARNAHIIQADIIAADFSANASGQNANSGYMTISGTVYKLTGEEIITVMAGETKIDLSQDLFDELYKQSGADDYILGQTTVTLYYKFGDFSAPVKIEPSSGKNDEEKAGSETGTQTNSGAGSNANASKSANAGTGKTAAGSQQSDEYSSDRTTIMSVIPQNEMTVTITIDELDILDVQPGMETRLTIDAFPGKSYNGTITGINTAGSNSGGNSKYTATITMEKEETMLPGMNASVLIPVRKYENVLAVPVKAISEKESKEILYKKYDEKTGEFSEPVIIVTGVSDGEYAEIISGVTENDTFWYHYSDKIDITSIFNGKTGNLGSLLQGSNAMRNVTGGMARQGRRR